MKNILKSIITIGFASMLLVSCGGSSSSTTAAGGGGGTSTLPTATGTLTFTGADASMILAGTTFNASNYTLVENTNQYTLSLNPDNSSATQATNVSYSESAGFVTVIVTSSNPSDAVATLKTWSAISPAGVSIDKTARTITFTSVSTAMSGGADVIINGAVNF